MNLNIHTPLNKHDKCGQKSIIKVIDEYGDSKTWDKQNKSYIFRLIYDLSQ